MELPQKTAFGRIIPKDRFYKGTDAKEAFTKQVERIRWAHKISADTMNIAKGAAVEEIEVIELTVNVPADTLNKRVLTLIHQAIPYKLLFEMIYDDITTYALYFDEKNLFTAKNSPKIIGNDLDRVWENLIRQMAGMELHDQRTLTEIIAVREKREKLEREMAGLAKKIKREKQLNRQMELNGELKRVKEELEGLL